MTAPDAPMNREAAEERLKEWADEHGWQIVFPNDALDDDVRPGVVDAVLVRAHPKTPDLLQIQMLRIRLGKGRPPVNEVKRLHESLERVSARTLYACFDDDDLHFVETDGWLGH